MPTHGPHDEHVRAADYVITMGCGDACPIFPGKRYEDWELVEDCPAIRRAGLWSQPDSG